MPKNKLLLKQEFVIIKDADPHEDVEKITVEFQYHEFDNDVSITIIDGKECITIVGDAALAFKQIMTDNNYIFKQFSRADWNKEKRI